MSTLDAYRAGIGAGVPLVIGATDDEFALVVHGVREPLDGLSGREALAALGLARPALDRYLAASGKASTSDLVGRYVTDRLFRTATLEVLAARGGQPPSWLYRFAWRSPVFGDVGALPRRAVLVRLPGSRPRRALAGPTASASAGG